MACLGHVHDAGTGEIATGYWLLAVEMHRADGSRQGLYLQAWSAQAEGFESENRDAARLGVGRALHAAAGAVGHGVDADVIHVLRQLLGVA
jgi:hypothetical protein